MSLCEAEKTFILHGVEENFRVDGREREDYRTMELETDIVAHAFGSARLRLADTDVLVAVKIEVDVPFPESPHQGKIEFFVDCSANATPDFEGRGGEDLAINLSSTLSSAYSSPLAFDLTKLCILHGKKCWKLYVDILILECGGNLFDAVSLAVKAALWNTQVPLVKNVNIDGNTVDINVSDELYNCTRLDVQKAPIMVTVCKIGEKCIVDPNAAEEQCSVGSVVVAVSGNKLSTVYQTGTGSLHPTTFLESINLGFRVAQRLDEALWESLDQIKPNQDFCEFNEKSKLNLSWKLFSMWMREGKYRDVDVIMNDLDEYFDFIIPDAIKFSSKLFPKQIFCALDASNPFNCPKL